MAKAKASSKKKAARKAAPKAAAKKKVVARKAAPAKKAARPKAPAWRPEGVTSVTTNLVVRDAARAIEFYKQAFGAQELMRMMSPDGKAVWHAEIRIGDAMLYLNDAMGPGPVAATPEHAPTCSFMMYVPDCDATLAQAMQAGCTATMPVEDMFWGDRMGGLTDPFGQHWMIATKKRDVSPEEAAKAGAEWAAKQQPPPPQAPPAISGTLT